MEDDYMNLPAPSKTPSVQVLNFFSPAMQKIYSDEIKALNVGSVLSYTTNISNLFE